MREAYIDSLCSILEKSMIGAWLLVIGKWMLIPCFKLLNFTFIIPRLDNDSLSYGVDTPGG